MGQSTTKVPDSAWATGGNPTKLDMFYYAPPDLPPNSPLVVAVNILPRQCAQELHLIEVPDPLLLRQRSNVFKLSKLYASRQPIQVRRHISSSDPRQPLLGREHGSNIDKRWGRRCRRHHQNDELHNRETSTGSQTHVCVRLVVRRNDDECDDGHLSRVLLRRSILLRNSIRVFTRFKRSKSHKRQLPLRQRRKQTHRTRMGSQSKNSHQRRLYR